MSSGLEYLGEVAVHAPSDGLVLQRSDVRQFAQTSLALPLYTPDCVEHFLSERSQFSVAFGFGEFPDGYGVLVRIDEPARAVASVVLDMEGFEPPGPVVGPAVRRSDRDRRSSGLPTAGEWGRRQGLSMTMP